MHYGYTVLEAENGKIALELFDRHANQISAVLLDLTMPVMNGEETLRFLRVRQRHVPVILSSGYAEDEATRRFVGKGLAGFIQKPYTAAHLANKIKSILQVANPFNTELYRACAPTPGTDPALAGAAAESWVFSFRRTATVVVDR